MAQMPEASPMDWIRLAAASDADRPHLIRESTEFAGASPKRLLRARGPNVREGRCG